MALRDLDRLAQQVKARRLNLGPIPLKRAAREAGVSHDTWIRVEAGKPVRDMTYTKIEPVLQWAPGSCIAVAEGRPAVPTVPSKADQEVSISTLQAEHLDPERLDAERRESVQLSTLATTKGLTGEQILALSARVVEDLKARGLI